MLPQGFLDNNKVWPDDGEIDLMEARGRLSQVIGSAIHFKANWGSHSFLSTEAHVDMENNFQDVFHSVTFEWKENSIKMFLDNSNEPFYEEGSQSNPLIGANYPFNEPFYLLLNVASGGNFDSAHETNTEMFCHNKECSNLSIPDRGRFLIDYIEYKSIE
jgi:beta-glucanase (GH16 family)